MAHQIKKYDLILQLLDERVQVHSNLLVLYSNCD